LRFFETTLNVKPIGKGRARATRQGRMYTPQQTVSAEAEIRWLLQKESPPCFEGPVYLMVKVYFKRPKTMPKGRELPTVKPDVSNVLKLIEDAANGILFKDDAQVCLASIQKVYGEPERIALCIGEM
jgi:Holliday junction resolvase RusA-like endonuclease